MKANEPADDVVARPEPRGPPRVLVVDDSPTIRQLVREVLRREPLGAEELEHGHQKGDQALQEIARVLTEGARQYDTVGRLGGEEFAVILPEITHQDARRVAERIRAAVEKSGEVTDLGTTVSIGLATGPAPGKDHPEALYRRADEQLYEAKNAGRNRVFPVL